jgi:hypothetical protein
MSSNYAFVLKVWRLLGQGDWAEKTVAETGGEVCEINEA